MRLHTEVVDAMLAGDEQEAAEETVVDQQEEVAEPQLPRTIAELSERLQETEISSKLLQKITDGLTAELRLYTGEIQTIEPLQPGAFEAFYDPAVPTIVVDPRVNFGGNSLLGIVAHEPETRANIIYIDPTTDHAKIVHAAESGNRLVLDKGVVILADGTIAYGSFPPVRADAFDTADIELIEQCEAAGILTLHSSAQEKQLDDKTQLRSIVKPETIKISPQIAEDDFLSRDDVSGLVLKPARLSQGTSIHMLDETTDAQRAKATYHFLQRHDYEPMVEERVRSWPIADPETGERLDWNARALTSNGSLLGMYVRADNWGRVINRSKGARAIAVEDLARYTEDEATACRLIATLGAAAMRLAVEHPSAIDGIDITVDEAGEAVLFELNGGRCGGMQTIAELEQRPQEKPTLARRLLAGWLQALPAPAQGLIYNAEDATEMSLTPSLVAWSDSLCDIDQEDLLGEVEIPEHFYNDSRDAAGITFALIKQWQIARMAQNDQESSAAEEKLFTHYPIQVRRYLNLMVPELIGQESLASYLAETDSLLPQGSNIHRAKANVALHNFDMATVAGLYEEAEQNGMSADEFVKGAAHTLAQRFRPVGVKELPKDFIVVMEAFCGAYCENGYEAAAELLSAKASEAPTMQRFKIIMSFAVAAGSREYSAALSLFKAYRADINFNDLAWDLVENQITDFTQTSEGRALHNAMCMEEGLINAATMNTIQHARQQGLNDETVKLLIDISKQLPFAATDEQRQTFVNMLSEISFLEPESVPKSSAIYAPATPDILVFGWLLKQYYARDASLDIDPVLNHFFDKYKNQYDVDLLLDRFHNEET